MDVRNLQLNPVHNELIKGFLELTRYQLAQRLKSIRHSFSNLLTFKVRENETYECDQVREMLIGLQELVIDEVENELADANYTSGLLIQKLLKTAEEWHLTLSTTISDLEDREKLNMIKEFDEQLRKSPDKMTITVITHEKQDATASNNISIDNNHTVDGINNENGPTSIAFVLKEKVTSLIQANEILQSKVEELEVQLKEATIEEDEPKDNDDVDDGDESLLSSTGKDDQPNKIYKTKKTIVSLSKELSVSQKEITSLRERLSQVTNSKESDLDNIQQSVELMRKDLEASRKLAEEQAEQLRNDLEARETKLRMVQSHLLLKEKELEQKFQSTTAYLNMKKILVQKNNIIKELRQKLVQVEVEAGQGNEIDLANKNKNNDLDQDEEVSISLD